MLAYVAISFIGFIVSFILLVLLKKLAIRRNLLLSARIPLIGGICIGVALLLIYSVIFLIDQQLVQGLWPIVSASLVILFFGIIDDCKELSILVKFITQIIAASLLVFGGVRTHIVYIGDFLNIVITFIWVIGISNAFNFLDITDGLAGIIALIVGFAFSLLLIITGNFNPLVLTLSLAGAILAFLIYNFPPAKIYMGNSGSHFLGFIFAAIALTISYASLENKVALLSPIIILGLPIFDAAFLIFIRLRNKKMPFNKSDDHMAFRLSLLGYSKRKILLIMVILGVFFSFSGVLLSRSSGYLSGLIIAAVVTVSLAAGIRASRVNLICTEKRS